MSFINYTNNPTARLQRNLIQSALALADYRMALDKSKPTPRWHVWPHGRRKAQGFCTLSYDGWGRGIGQWWLLSGEVPQKVWNVIATCVAEPQVTSRGGEG
jgi:hypothetical protein